MCEWFRRVGRLRPGVNPVDRAISHVIARRAPSRLDAAMKSLTTAANHSVLWFLLAGILAARKGATRKAALRGVLAIAGASGIANALLKPLLPRRRPAAGELPAHRTLPDPPTSSAFPSGHAASAAAFATAVALESPRVGLALAPLAGAVAYSRVHVGVHWGSDVVAGAAVGSAIALATRRWWPVRRSDEARARPVDAVPPLPKGEGLVMVANPFAGDPGVDPATEIETALPAARVLRVADGGAIDDQLEQAIAAGDGTVRAVGAAGGDGTAAAVAAVASRYDLPLVLVPAGTLNHFARDVGVYDLQEALDATTVGEAVAVDLGLVQAHPGTDPDPPSGEVIRTRYFLNTASIGSYPELVRLRERWQRRWGKWPAFAAALITVLRRSERVEVKIADEWHLVWFLFVGNGTYHPRGMVPAWRPSLDSGLLDVRWLRADLRFSRIRAFLALALGALGHSRVYAQREVDHLDVELRMPAMLATDGEVVEEAGRYTFRVAARPIPVYRRDEQNWTGRDRPYLG
ncbi:bifunctional phosphatase PAP2/diacylglycerol kinase family protein [Pseudonocardia hispaniensis]|uniref:Bifunctional phosphatase PAP2/diacylglycerol kinase family protein n=1 Tax=Pseudonocardia hispaniensis TaxID=904933 RepID=A0ABW1J2J2_9PSEU